MTEPLYRAAINCRHEIDEDKVVLYFDRSKPGHNALNQLAGRLDAAQATAISEERSMRESCERGGELLAKDAQEYRRYAGELRRLLQLVRTHVGGGWLETAYPSLPQQIDAALAKHPTVPEIGKVGVDLSSGPDRTFVHCHECRETGGCETPEKCIAERDGPAIGPTPRTDAAKIEVGSFYGPQQMVPIEFARELEREIGSNVRAAAERMVKTFRDWMAGCDNGTRWKEVEAAHINLRDALACHSQSTVRDLKPGDRVRYLKPDGYKCPTKDLEGREGTVIEPGAAHGVWCVRVDGFPNTSSPGFDLWGARREWVEIIGDAQGKVRG